MDYREEFLQIWHQHVSRPGSEKLLDWLDNKTDFFSAPASTRFHGACRSEEQRLNSSHPLSSRMPSSA